jgi:hypothetical protein
MRKDRDKVASEGFWPEKMKITRVTLPLWLFLWATALIVFIDITMLRADPEQVKVVSYEQRRVFKNRVCDLTLEFSSGSFTRTTDRDTCHEVKRDDTLTLERTKLIKRWMGLYNQDDDLLTGGLLESRYIQDIFFVLLAPLMIFVGRAFIAPNLILGVLVFGAGYYWLLVFQ